LCWIGGWAFIVLFWVWLIGRLVKQCWCFSDTCTELFVNALLTVVVALFAAWVFLWT
jgi:hypothetical protein